MNNHEQKPQIPIHAFGEGDFANTIRDPNEIAFFENAKKEAGRHIDVSGGDSSSMPIEVNRAEASDLQTRLDTPVYEPRGTEDLAKRRAESKPKKMGPVRSTLLGALAAMTTLGGGHLIGERMDNAAKQQDKSTELVRQNVQNNIDANKHFEAGRQIDK